MKASDVVQVNITNDPVSFETTFRNREAVAVILLHTTVGGATDTEWKNFNEILTSETGVIKTVMQNWQDTFEIHGGDVSFTKIKRIKYDSNNMIKDIKDAVNGKDAIKPLITNIIQVQLLWTSDVINTAMTEESLVSICNDFSSDDSQLSTKLVYVTKPETPTVTSRTTKNLIWVQTSLAASATQVWESALIMAHYSSIKFNNNTLVKDVEYSSWLGTPFVSPVDEYVLGVGDTNYNFISEVILSNGVDYRLLIGGKVRSGERIQTIYFETVIAQLCTDILAILLFDKIRIGPGMYPLIYGSLATTLDRFTIKQLFDGDFISDINKIVTRDSITYTTISVNERLPYGYKLVTLPITRQEKRDRVYRGIRLYIAFGGQIKELTLQGLAIGGI